MTEPLQALRAAQATGDDWQQFFAMKQPVCPHCGTEYVIAEHDAWRMYEEGEHEATCGHCDLDFTVSVSVSYSFSTDTQDEPEAEGEKP
jgi:ribosomal protein S27AE